MGKARTAKRGGRADAAAPEPNRAPRGARRYAPLPTLHAPRDLPPHALFALAHDPVVVEGKDRLEQELQPAKEGLLGAHPPRVGESDVSHRLDELPFAEANQLARTPAAG